jgi:hypothetical protein
LAFRKIISYWLIDDILADKLLKNLRELTINFYKMENIFHNVSLHQVGVTVWRLSM